MNGDLTMASKIIILNGALTLALLPQHWLRVNGRLPIGGSVVQSLAPAVNNVRYPNAPVGM